MAAFGILFVVNRILIAIFLIFCCLSFFLTLKNEYEIEKTRQYGVDKQTQTVKQSNVVENEYPDKIELVIGNESHDG